MMLYRNEDKYALMPFLATFEQHGEVHEQYVVNKKELEDFEKMGHIKSLTFEEVQHDKGMLDRLVEVERYPDSEFQAAQQYVVEGEVLEGTSLALKKQNELLEASIGELTMLIMGGFE